MLIAFIYSATLATDAWPPDEFADGRLDDELLPEETRNLGCKNWEAPWPFPCRNPKAGWAPAWNDEYPIIAWWQPTVDQLPAYAKANFSLVFTRNDWDGHDLTDDAAIDVVAAYVEAAAKLGLVSSFGSSSGAPMRRWRGPPEPPVTWGNATGGLTRGVVGLEWQTDVPPSNGMPWDWRINGREWAGEAPTSAGASGHYLTLPEVQWLVARFRERGLLGGGARKLGLLFLHDDEMDILEEAIEIATWLRAHQPDLVPHVNEVIDDAAPGSLQRRSFFISSNEAYHIWQGHGAPSHPRGSAALMATLQLMSFDTHWRNQHRYRLESWPLVNIGDGHSTCCVTADSLIRLMGSDGHSDRTPNGRLIRP